MPLASLYFSCFSRLRSVSSMVMRIDWVILSAYIITLPLMFRAARPAVWVSARAERKNPSLSASIMATSETSGKSNPSRRRLTPTSTSKTPFLKSSIISTRSMVSTSEWMYRQRISNFTRYFTSSSAIRFVRVVTRIRSFFTTLLFISPTKSSTCVKLGRISITGSSSPVGRISCSTTTPSHLASS